MGRREPEHHPANLPGNAQQVDSGAPPNVNVKIDSVIDSLNVNVSTVVEYLRWIFGEAPAKRGYYHNLYNKQRCQNPEVWLAAAIDTLIGLHKTKTVREPGKYFCDRCVLFHRSGIPPDTAALIQQYGSLPYPQLVQALEHLESAGSRSSAPGSPPRGQSPRGSLMIRRLPRDKFHPGMSREDLTRLIDLLGRDERTCTFVMQPYRQADGSCALLVDDTMGHQRWIYNLGEWQQDLARIQSARDLFPGTPQKNDKIHI